MILNPESFPGFSPQRVVALLVDNPRASSTLVNSLPSLTALPGEVGERLVSFGHGVKVLEYASRFNFSPENVLRIADIAAERNRMELVLTFPRFFPKELLTLVEEKYHVAEFDRLFQINSSSLYCQFLEHKQAGRESSLVELSAAVRRTRERAASFEPVSEVTLQNPLYRRFVQQLFPSHYPGHFDEEYGALDRCSDHAKHLAQFTLRERYPIDLAEGIRMALRDGEQEDDSRFKSALQQVEEVQQQLERNHYRAASLGDQFDESLKERSFPAIFQTREEKLFALFLYSLNGSIPVTELKAALHAYHAIEYDNIAAYFRGTRGAASQSMTPRYAHLLELHEYFGDKLHDAITKIVDQVAQNPQIVSVLPNYLESITRRDQQREQKEALDRHRVDRAGLTPQLLERLEEILRLPESELEGGLARKAQIVSNIISAEQRKLAAIHKTSTGESLDPETIHLEQFEVPEVVGGVQSNKSHDESPSSGLALLNHRFENLFRDELRLIEAELKRYKPESDAAGKLLTLNGYITKSVNSVFARSVAGVCVGGDNPRTPRPEGDQNHRQKKNQWDQENFFQMVFQDAETQRCEGVVMLHHYRRLGKKILTASINPTSTFLFKVDQRALFQGILKQLVTFAKDNGFDFVTCSAHRHIRTNRTGGRFEQALDSQIEKVGVTLSLGVPQVFSFSPSYYQDELDVLWQRKPLSLPQRALHAARPAARVRNLIERIRNR